MHNKPVNSLRVEEAALSQGRKKPCAIAVAFSDTQGATRPPQPMPEASHSMWTGGYKNWTGQMGCVKASRVVPCRNRSSARRVVTGHSVTSNLSVAVDFGILILKCIAKH